MTTIIRLLPILLFLFALAIPDTAAHDRAPIPTITPYIPHGQPWTASYRSYQNTQLDTYLRANRAREQAIFTRMQATGHAQWTAQATPRTRPTPTPEPVVSHNTSLETRRWRVSVLAVEWNYEEIVRQAGYSTYGLLPGEQWVAVKLRVTNIFHGHDGYRHTLDVIGLALRTQSERIFKVPHGQAPLRAHTQTLREYLRQGIGDGSTEISWPRLPSEYHALPYEFHPDVPTEGWRVWAVRTEDVAGLQLGIMSGDYGYSWWNLD